MKTAHHAFVRAFDRSPTFLVVAPGRVNLIGEHIDYNGLPVLPMALERGITLAVGARDDPTVRISSESPGFHVREFAVSPAMAPYETGDWGNYVKAGVLAALEVEPSLTHGMDAVVQSTVPAAAGLSSSSALVVAVLLALLEVNRRGVPANTLMEVAARAERFVGTQGGGMDQAVCLGAVPGAAVRIAFDPLVLTPVPIPAEWRFVVAFSGVRAAKSAAAQAVYNQRTAECREALALVSSILGSADVEQTYGSLLSRYGADTLDAIGTDCLRSPLRERFRHVVREAERVDAAVDALHAGDAQRFGQLMTASHASLRDDYEVSAPALNDLVDAALDAGALGARLTGAGFGGCIVALTTPANLDRVQTQLTDALRQQPDGEVFEATAAGPADVERVDRS